MISLFLTENLMDIDIWTGFISRLLALVVYSVHDLIRTFHTFQHMHNPRQHIQSSPSLRTST